MPKTYTAVTVANATAGNAILASDHSTNFQNVNNLIVPPLCVMENSGAVSIANNTWTAVTFTSEIADTDAMHDNSTNTSRITINTAGVYLVMGGGRMAAFSSTTTARLLGIYKNGVEYMRLQGDASTVNNAVDYHVSGGLFMSLVATDYIELRWYQDSGSARNVTNNFFSAKWVGLAA